MIKRNRTSELVVKPRISRHVQIAIYAALSVFLAIVIAGVYRYGLSQSGFEFGVASRAQAQLSEQISNLRAKNAELEEALARAQRGQQVNTKTYRELEENLKDAAREIARLREELSFYRNIVSPANKQAGVRIQKLDIEKSAGPGHFQYKLVLIQALKHDRQILGRAHFEIEGLQAGSRRVIRIAKINGREIIVNFKYFQDIKGVFELPLAFEPSRVKVVVETRGPQAVKLTQHYDWPRSTQ